MPVEQSLSVVIDANLAQRLRGLARSSVYSGVLYGLASNKEEQTLIWTATGHESSLEEVDAELELLTEVIPCGIDPIGVFYFANIDNNDNNDDDMDRIQKLIHALPEALLEHTDPIVLTRALKEDEICLSAFLHSGNLIEAKLIEQNSSEIEEKCQVIRVRGNFEVVAQKSENDLQQAFKYLIEKVSCPYGSFRLCNSSLFFLHTWQPDRVFGRHGWADADFGPEKPADEGCKIVNYDGDQSSDSIDNLFNYLDDDLEDEDDGFGVADNKDKQKKKKSVEPKETLNFELVMKMSGDACSSRTVNCAPVAHYEKRQMSVVRIPLAVDAIGLARRSTRVEDLMEILKGCVQRQLVEMCRSVISELKMRGTISTPEVFHLKPEPLGHLCSIIYNQTGDCLNFAEFRKHIHDAFFLPLDKPLFRRGNKHLFQDDLPKSGPLINPHLGLKNPVGDDGEVALVQGKYTYHHYMQDEFNDEGWGCAYRSLQTLISWFRMQGYVGTSIPTHSEIQKCLVSIGDKPSSFQGSKQWIGSTEVSFVLETSCNISSKMIVVNKGSEMASRASDLLHHFRTQGTPVMIGGGVLAHTIIGVAFDDNKTFWLILDPHFTGNDRDRRSGKSNLGLIQSKGWVNWKGVEFWKKDAFYNMCLPQRPTQW